MYASIPEFVEKLLTLTAKASTDPINSDAVTKLVNGFVKSVCREKNEQEKQKKEEKKEAKKAKNEAKKTGKVKEKSEMDKPLNAYIRYCMAKRPSIVGVPENKNKPPKEITAILAKEWRKERDQGSDFFNELQQQADDASAKYKKEKEKATAKTESIEEKHPFDEKVSTPKKMKKEEKEKAPDAPKKEKKEKKEKVKKEKVKKDRDGDAKKELDFGQ